MCAGTVQTFCVSPSAICPCCCTAAAMVCWHLCRVSEPDMITMDCGAAAQARAILSEFKAQGSELADITAQLRQDGDDIDAQMSDEAAPARRSLRAALNASAKESTSSVSARLLRLQARANALDQACQQLGDQMRPDEVVYVPQHLLPHETYSDVVGQV